MSRDLLVAQIPALRRYAKALTGSAWLADDLVQDTLERACVKWRLWLVGSNLRSWLFCIMHNLFINQWRHSSSSTGLQQIDIAEVVHDLQAPESDPTLAVDLQRCLLQLPIEQREVLLLVCLEDLSYAEVAKVTGVPLGTVMSRLSRARTRMQMLMEQPCKPIADTVIKPSATPRQSTLHRLK